MGRTGVSYDDPETWRVDAQGESDLGLAVKNRVGDDFRDEKLGVLDEVGREVVLMVSDELACDASRVNRRRQFDSHRFWRRSIVEVCGFGGVHP